VFRSFQVLLVQPTPDNYRDCFFWVKPKDMKKNFLQKLNNIGYPQKIDLTRKNEALSLE